MDAKKRELRKGKFQCVFIRGSILAVLLEYEELIRQKLIPLADAKIHAARSALPSR